MDPEIIPYTTHTIARLENGTLKPFAHRLIREEPLEIRVEGRLLTTVMRTPGHEIAHAAGFCLAEGIVDKAEEINTLALCDTGNCNVVTVTLSESRREQVKPLLGRTRFISQTSCGVCGREMILELSRFIEPLADTVRVPAQEIFQLAARLNAYQPLRGVTRSTHAAVLFDQELAPLTGAEDVGRHNAVDKAIGKLFLEGTLQRAKVLVLSSRISYELVQKAGRAGIPVIIGLSRPTLLAVELAEKLNLALASRDKDEGFLVFCGQERFQLPEPPG